MPAREKSDIISGGFTGMNILKALRDGGATDDDLRRIISTPTVRDSVVRTLKAEPPQLSDMIGRAYETLTKVLKEAVVHYRIPFAVSVRLGTRQQTKEALLCASSLESLLGSKVICEAKTSEVIMWIVG